MKKFQYRKIPVYKYQLTDHFVFQTNIKHSEDCISEYADLFDNGEISIGEGYAWDGCSGPTIDDKTNMKASLVHDALYQLMEEGLLPVNYKEKVDLEFYRMLMKDGMGWFRANCYYYAVKYFGKVRVKNGTN